MNKKYFWNLLACILVAMIVCVSANAQNKRVERIDVYWDKKSSTPDESYLYQYDNNGRLVRVYDEENYRKYQQELILEYDEANGQITINGLMPGYKGEHDDKGKSIVTVKDGRIIKIVEINSYGSQSTNLVYNEQGEWTEWGQSGMTNVWSNGNIVKLVSEDESTEVTAYTDIDYPSSFPFFYIPGMEYDAFDMPSPLFHLGSLFGKRQSKLPASVQSFYDGSLDVSMEYSYKLDSEGNVTEICQSWKWDGYSENPRLVLFYGDAVTTSVSDLGGDDGSLGSKSYYNLSGQRVAKPTHGLVIIKEPNGRTKKVMMKPVR